MLWFARFIRTVCSLISSLKNMFVVFKQHNNQNHKALLTYVIKIQDQKLQYPSNIQLMLKYHGLYFSLLVSPTKANDKMYHQ